MKIEMIYLNSNQKNREVERDLTFKLGETVLFVPSIGDIERKDPIIHLKNKKFEIIGTSIYSNKITKHNLICYKVKACENIPYTKEMKEHSYLDFNNEEVVFFEYNLKRII